MTYGDLVKISGVDSAKATTLLAAFELTNRAIDVNDANLPIINTTKDAVAQLTDIRDLKKEHFLALYINARNKLIHKEIISIGTLTANLVHPREVFEPAMVRAATEIIVSHNHPSGDSKPSSADLEITKRLVEAGKILGIKVLNHIIITKENYLSFQDEGLI
jgi:DNA repair protein RadC